MTAPEPDWLLVADVVAYARSNRTEVQEALKSGALRGYQITAGGKWRVHRDDVDAWIRGVPPASVAAKFTRRAS